MISIRADGWVQYGPWTVITTFLHEGLGLRDADLVFQRSLAAAPTGMQRGNLLQVQFLFALMRGRSSGLPLPEFWIGPGPNTQRVIDALFADGDPAPAVPAAEALQRAVGTPLGDDCCLDRFMAAQSALEAGRLSTARRALADIERVARGSDTATASALARANGAILAAQISVREGTPSAAERLRQLDSVLADPHGDWEWVPLLGNLIAARLHERQGEFDQALAAIRRRDWSAIPPIYVTYHREEGRMAAEAADTAGAIRAYRRYLRIRADAEPRLQPEVQRIRAELAALERASPTR